MLIFNYKIFCLWCIEGAKGHLERLWLFSSDFITISMVIGRAILKNNEHIKCKPATFTLSQELVKMPEEHTKLLLLMCLGE